MSTNHAERAVRRDSSRSAGVVRKLLTPPVYMSIAGIALLVLIPLFSGSAFIVHVFVTIFLYTALASAWNIVGGFVGQLSLGHATFYGIGGYSALLVMNQGISPWLGMLLGGVVSAFVGVVISYPCFRLRGPFFALGSIAFLDVFRLLAIHFKQLTGGSAGLIAPMIFGWEWMVFRDKYAYLFLALGAMLLTMAVSIAIRKSRLGYYFIAVREREDAAMALGINTVRMKLYAVMISAMLTAMTGSIHAVYISFIDPATMFALSFSIQIAMFALIGGQGTVAGPLAGTLLVVPLTELARGWLGGSANGLHGFVYGVVLVICVLTMRAGIVGTFQDFFTRLLARMPGAIPREEPELAQATTRVADAVAPGEPVMTALNISKRFGGLVAANRISLTLRKGEILGIIGPNGAGKTTLFNLLSGFLTPDEGEVEIALRAGRAAPPEDGRPETPPAGEADAYAVRPTTPHSYARAGVGRTFQIVQPFGRLSVLENILIGALAHHASVDEAYAKALQVAKCVELYDDRHSIANSLTIGGLKRLEVARVLAMEPRILLLDEVMAGQNPAEVKNMIDMIRNLRDSGITIMAIEHNMHAIMSISNRIVVINAGTVIAEGTPDEVARNRQVIEAYLGEEYTHAHA
jgi:branched-chain amino acid transport system permease protein